MDMDRSFLGFKNFLLRIINGPDLPRPAVEQARRAKVKASAKDREDWARIEL